MDAPSGADVTDVQALDGVAMLPLANRQPTLRTSRSDFDIPSMLLVVLVCSCRAVDTTLMG